MSRENVELRNDAVRRWLASFDSDPAAFRDALHHEVEWFPIEENHSGYYGIEAAMRYRDRWLETWEAHRYDIEEVIENGDDVVALVHIVARGRASGVPTEMRFYARWKVKDGKVLLVHDHPDRTTALEAAGLRE
jgi:ketosteroid isomerase-like protein